jgi:hypothetical protein
LIRFKARRRKGKKLKEDREENELEIDTRFDHFTCKSSFFTRILRVYFSLFTRVRREPAVFLRRSERSLVFGLEGN